jgi:hypothetical protein
MHPSFMQAAIAGPVKWLLTQQFEEGCALSIWIMQDLIFNLVTNID